MANFFPRWTNWLPLKIMICGVVIVTALVGATWYYDTPKYTRVGYMPTQPVPFRTIFTLRSWEWIADIATTRSRSPRTPTFPTPKSA